jgi:hypothetical protein
MTILVACLMSSVFLIGTLTPLEPIASDSSADSSSSVEGLSLYACSWNLPLSTLLSHLSSGAALRVNPLPLSEALY